MKESISKIHANLLSLKKYIENKGNGTLLFMLSLLVVFALLGFYKVMFLRPQSIHQWAQCDRASVALNYAEDDMNFFLPRVHNCRDKTGITGLEFPIMNYAAAVCYKIFGFNEFWYRFLMLVTISGALLMAFRFSREYLKSIYLALLGVLLWYLSPVLNYYSPNFVPDTASLAFGIMSWMLFFKLAESFSYKRLIYWFVCITLSSLIKVTSAISIVAVLCLLFLDYFRWFGLKRSIKKQWLIILFSFGSILLVFAWYAWAQYITTKYEARYFAQTIVTVSSFEEFLKVWKGIKDLWLDYYYNWWMYAAFGVFFVLNLIFIKRINILVTLAMLLLFAGNMFVLALFFKQFDVHDYYIIILLLPFLLLTIQTLKIVSSFGVKWIRVACISIIFILFFYSLRFSIRHQQTRYEGWMAQQTYCRDHMMLEPQLRALGIKHSDKVLSMYDCSLNISLYLMNQKGWIAYYSDSEDYFEKAIHDCKYAVVTNMDTLMAKPYKKYFKKILKRVGGVFVFELSHTPLPDSLILSKEKITYNLHYAYSFEKSTVDNKSFIDERGEVYEKSPALAREFRTGKGACLVTAINAYSLKHDLDICKEGDKVTLCIWEKCKDNQGALVMLVQGEGMQSRWETSTPSVTDSLGWKKLQIDAVIPHLEKEQELIFYVYTTADSVHFDDLSIDITRYKK